MGYFLAEVDVDEADSLVGKTGTINPDYLAKAFKLVKDEEMLEWNRTSEPVVFEGLSPTDSFEIVRHYQLGTFWTAGGMRTEVGGPAALTAPNHFETPFHDSNVVDDAVVLDITRVTVKTGNGKEHVLPGTAVSISEASPS